MSTESTNLNSLGLPKEPKDTRVVVAMSGGVDSSVTAAMLHEEGYDVVGITLQLYDHGEIIARTGACCAGQDIYDARTVADTFGFPHYVLDYESKFKESVIEDFADSYARGETPIPCVRCNQTVKFKDLLDTAKDLGADVLATGHYVQRNGDETDAQMLKGADPKKDQSYFLFATTQEQLDFLRFPLGHMDKTETRALADKFNLTVADKPDSQDICFVPDGNYASIVEKFRPEAVEAGDIVHIDGEVLGTHKGIIHYTVGQRRGLGIGGRGANSGTDPLYVVKIDPENRQVIVGPKSALATPRIRLSDVNWLGDTKLSQGPVEIGVKVRSTMQPVAATVEATELGDVEVTFAEPMNGVSPGQACVFYQGDRVLGGGWIQRRIS
ncbi:tRNA 2-thiouridine(34) synthase MnmA [Curvivirga sp.]|uniref:tRNA 2-thiouridine(34) synthase MnmA n=1 Tax=Curvivirga sp. TaxID=2856848 RepID=UPI003B5C046C